MTKKDPEKTQDPANKDDFFSDISQDLQQHVGGLDQEEDSSHEVSTANNENSDMFAAPDETNDATGSDMYSEVPRTTVETSPIEPVEEEATMSSDEHSTASDVPSEKSETTTPTQAAEYTSEDAVAQAKTDDTSEAPTSQSDEASENTTLSAEDSETQATDASETPQQEEAAIAETNDHDDAQAEDDAQASSHAEANAEESAQDASAEAETSSVEAVSNEEASQEQASEEASDEEASSTVVRSTHDGPRPSVLAQEGEEKEFVHVEEGTEIQGAQTYKLTQILSRVPDRLLWQSYTEIDGEQVSFLTEELSPQRYRQGYQRCPEVPEAKMLRADEVIEQEDRVFVLFKERAGYRLEEQLHNPEHQWSLAEIRAMINHIGETLKAIHEAGYYFLQLDAHDIWLQDDGVPYFMGIEKLYHPRTPTDLRPKIEGYSAPEVFQQHPKISASSDIFSLGLLLHYMISRLTAPFSHLENTYAELPSPRVFNLGFPNGLDHVLLRAYHPEQEQRYQSMDEFLESFNKAIDEMEVRASQDSKVLQLSLGHDIHIGVNKGLRNPINQDALFWRYDRERGKGLFLVADGVSHCEYGSGDRASSLVIQAARKRWDTLLGKPLMDEPLSHEQRSKIIDSIFAAANNAICREINNRYPRIDGYVEDVMGSTCVAGFIDGNRLTVANLGDSRGYLKTADFIEQITIDHDYKTAQLQAFQDLRALSSLVGGSLITRCVGSFTKDEQMKLGTQPMQPDFFELTLKPGDIVLLCSDGLSDYSGENEEQSRQVIAHLLDAYPEPMSACFWLMALANQNGGGDNISMIEIKVLVD